MFCAARVVATFNEHCGCPADNIATATEAWIRCNGGTPCSKQWININSMVYFNIPQKDDSWRPTHPCWHWRCSLGWSRQHQDNVSCFQWKYRWWKPLIFMFGLDISWPVNLRLNYWGKVATGAAAARRESLSQYWREAAGGWARGRGRVTTLSNQHNFNKVWLQGFVCFQSLHFMIPSNVSSFQIQMLDAAGRLSNYQNS